MSHVLGSSGCATHRGRIVGMPVPSEMKKTVYQYERSW